jgi:transcriptional regulator with XRE-family HTH domain
MSAVTEAEILAAADYAEVLQTWRERRGLSKRALAERMHYDRSYVVHIENGNQRPTEDFTRRAEDVLATEGALWSAWNTFVAVRTRQRRPASAGTTRDLRNPAYLSWVAERSPLSFQEAYNSVAHLIDEVEVEPPAVRHARMQARSNVSRQDITEALIDYYDAPLAGDGDGLGFYAAHVEGAEAQRLSMLTHPDWLDVDVELGGGAERTRFASSHDEPEPLDLIGLRAALRRLAEVEASDTVLVNNPLYRLTDITVGRGTLDATFATTDFLTYALRNDLLELEIVDALANGARPGQPDGSGAARLALRERYLPDISHALDLASRLCVGGLGALLAVARPDADDYMLLVQERSAQVLNLTGRLALIPKAFHQPTVEANRETALSSTVLRELEEELLGREDLEMLADARHADPLHDASRSEPMQWLAEHRDTGAVRIECTGFGINMVTGNYEFACLVVIDDPTWWQSYGHLVGANWEALRLRRYSTRDTSGLVTLAADPAWSTEGLFTYLLGLRRLAEIGTADRTSLPEIGNP